MNEQVNIWTENLDNIYKQNEVSNKGGWFPVGKNEDWHSGIHLYEENIYPILDGEIIAYRQGRKFAQIKRKQELTWDEFLELDETEKKYYDSNTRKLKNEIKELVPQNFYLIRHKILDNKFIFYSLYHNMTPADVQLEKYRNDFIQLDNLLLQKKLPFTEEWQYKVIPTEENICTSIFNANLFFDSCIHGTNFLESVKSLLDTFSSNKDILISTYPKSIAIPPIRVNSKIVKLTKIICPFTNATLNKRKEDLLFEGKKENKNVGKGTNLKFSLTEKQIQNNEIFLSSLTRQSFTNNSDYTIDSEYEKMNILLPITHLETEQDKQISKLYSRRPGTSSELRFRIRYSDKKDYNITKDNCPLYYEKINFEKKILDDSYIILSEEELYSILNEKLPENKYIQFEYNKIEKRLITNIVFLEGENIEEIKTDANNFAILKISNIIDTDDKEYKFFIDGLQYEPFYIDDENLGKYITKNKKSFTIKENTIKINEKITILLTKTLCVYKNDTYKTYNKNKLKGFDFSKNTSGYVCCTNFIQNDVERNYDIDTGAIKVTEYFGKIKKEEISEKDCFEVKNTILFYNNFLNDIYLDNSPVKIITKGTEFNCSSIPIVEGNSCIFTDIIFKGDMNTYSAKIPIKNLQIKLIDKKINNKTIIEKDGILHDISNSKQSINISSNEILGYPSYSKEVLNKSKKINCEPYFDVSIFLKQNYFNQKFKDTENLYKLYTELDKNEILYEDINKPSIFYCTKNSEIFVRTSRIINQKKFCLFYFKRFAVYLNQKYIEEINGSISISSFPSYIFLNNLKVYPNSTGTTSYINRIFYNKERINKLIRFKQVFEYVNNNSEKNLKGLLLKDELIENNDYFWIFNSKSLRKGQIYTFTNDEKSIYAYNKCPINSLGDIKMEAIFLPKGTKIYCSELSNTNQVFAKVKIKEIPIFIYSSFLKFNRYYQFKDQIKQGKSTVDYFYLSYTKVTKSDVKNNSNISEIAAGFFNNINIFINNKNFEYITDNGKGDICVYIDAKDLKITKDYYILDQYEIGLNKINKSLDFNLYTKNPLETLILSKKEKLSSREIATIDESQIYYDEIKGMYYQINLKDDSATYYIKKENCNKYIQNGTDWKKFFYICKESNEQFPNIDKIFDELDFEENEKKLLNEYKNDSFKKNHIISSLYDNKSDTNTIINKLHKAVVTHKHELDLDFYNPIQKEERDYKKELFTAIGIIKPLKDENKITEITANNNLLTFVHPVYFMNHIISAGMIEINPYKNKTYEDIYVGSKENKNRLYGHKEYSSFIIKDNPGFAVLYTNNCSGTKFGNYTGMTGAFNADYSKIYKRTRWHEGIDFRGPGNTPVHSLVFAKVIDCGKVTNNSTIHGYVILNSISKPNIYYLAWHLDDTKIFVKPNDIVYPGKKVAETYNFPATDEVSSHLHVSVIDLQNGITYNDEQRRGFMRPEANIKEFYVAYAKHLYKNPFNYLEPWKCEEKDL